MVADKPHVAVAVAGRSEAVAAKTRRERIEQEAAAIGGRREHGIEADPEWIEQEPIPLLLARPTLGDLSCYLDSIGQVVGQGVDINTSDAIEQIATVGGAFGYRSEEHTSELQSLMRISYAVFCLKKKKNAEKYINT